MEARFGYDLGTVRVHSGNEAAVAADAVGAHAFTFGADIVFGHDEYVPQTTRGAWLLAHELAHVIQQSRGGPRHIDNRASLENAADRAATAPAGTPGPVLVSGASAPSVAAKERKEPRDPGMTAFLANRYHAVFGLRKGEVPAGWPYREDLKALWRATRAHWTLDTAGKIRVLTNDELGSAAARPFLDAVREYQKSKGIKPAKGVIGPATAKALLADAKAAASQARKTSHRGEDKPSKSRLAGEPPKQSRARQPRSRRERSSRRRVDDAVKLLRRAMHHHLGGNSERAMEILSLIQKFITEITTESNFDEKFGSLNGLARTEMRERLNDATGSIQYIVNGLKGANALNRAQWKHQMQRFRYTRDILEVLAGEVQVEKAKSIQDYEHVSKTALNVSLAAMGAVVVLGGVAYVVTIAPTAYALATVFYVEHTALAVLLADLTAAKTIEYVATGTVTVSPDETVLLLIHLRNGGRYRGKGKVKSVSGRKIKVEVTEAPAEAKKHKAKPRLTRNQLKKQRRDRRGPRTRAQRRAAGVLPRQKRKPRWNDPKLTEDAHLDLYDGPMEAQKVRERFRDGWRFDPKTRRWSKPHSKQKTPRPGKADRPTKKGTTGIIREQWGAHEDATTEWLSKKLGYPADFVAVQVKIQAYGPPRGMPGQKPTGRSKGPVFWCDNAAAKGAGAPVDLFDAKLQNAGPTAMQSTGWPAVLKYGGRIIHSNNPNIPAGAEIAPGTAVQVVRPDDITAD